MKRDSLLKTIMASMHTDVLTAHTHTHINSIFIIPNANISLQRFQLKDK